jgi:hypothetical protein
MQADGAVAVAGLAVMALAPLQRFRRAGLVQRQQLKWFTFVVGGCFASLLAAVAIHTVLPVVAGWLVAVASAGVVVGLPVAVGVAVLRYQLYDIDRLISRTLVYATLTVVLGLGYGGLVLVLGQLFGTVGECTPSLAVAAATLAVATLFQPARRRLQAVVDRRFNRRRPHDRSVQRPPPRPDRPGHPGDRAVRRGRPDHAAHHRVAVATSHAQRGSNQAYRSAAAVTAGP